MQTQSADRVSVLLVEDNQVNAEVTVDLLSIMGIDADVASDGNRALELFEARAYSLVLMDCEMPVMDGFSTTVQLRRIEDAAGQAPVPIIALTAHDVGGAREKCIASGMDDFLSKPYNIAELRLVLNRWLDTELQEVVARQSEPGNDDLCGLRYNAAVLDHDVLNRLYVKGGAVNVKLLSKILTMYLEQTSLLLDELTTVMKAQDAESVRKVAHTLKSSSVNIGALGFSEKCRCVELACEQGLYDEAHVLDVIQQYADVELAVSELLDSPAMQ